MKSAPRVRRCNRRDVRQTQLLDQPVLQRAEGSLDPALRLRTVGADDVDVQIHQRTAKLRDAIAADRVLRIHLENTLLVAVKGNGLAVCLQIRTGHSEVFEGRL